MCHVIITPFRRRAGDAFSRLTWPNPRSLFAHPWLASVRFPVQQGTGGPVFRISRLASVARSRPPPQLQLDHLKSNMVYTKSQFSHVPDFPTDTNAWSFLLNHPLGFPAPVPDHVMFVDGLTGFKRTRYEFLERVELAAAALTTARGGLGLKPTDVVAVLSGNCLVITTSLRY